MDAKPPILRVLSCDATVNEARTRMPFRYGNACLTEVPILLVRVEIEVDGCRRGTGLAADCLPPLWFDKDTDKGYERDVGDQIRAYEIARDVYMSASQRPSAVHDLWREALPRVLTAAGQEGINALTGSFGSSFLERALIDALCRAMESSFFEALAGNSLGLDSAQDLLEAPLRHVSCRHTVGLGDALTAAEVADEARLDDGLPQALEEDIEVYGLRYLKVKTNGDHAHDLERLTRIASVLGERCGPDYRVSLDGNEQYADLNGLASLLEDLRSSPHGRRFVDAILFIEQPLPRHLALDSAAAAGVRALSELKPVIIDESDDRPEAFAKAVSLGYRGVSHKNCKGVLKSLTNRRRVRELNAAAGRELYFQTGEDLANLGVVQLQQDLASVSALGITHVERNGHHYFHGLDHLPAGEPERALAAHPDLYERRGESVCLRVRDGLIDCGSLTACRGYGYGSEIAFSSRTPLDEWSFDRLYDEDAGA